ncbi:hypothetical protein ACFLZ2_04220 [Candidatus Margulisiibacteriota bacterium]
MSKEEKNKKSYISKNEIPDFVSALNGEDKRTVTKLEDSLKEFWKDYGRTLSYKGRHTQVRVEPKFVIGNKINPEIAKRIVMIYLMQMTSDKVVEGEVKIDSDGLKIFDKGKQVAHISDVNTIDNMRNKVTCQLGRELAKKENKEGSSYLSANERGIYSFGEIKQALVDFLFDAEKHDSKNLLKDAVLLLMKN